MDTPQYVILFPTGYSKPLLSSIGEKLAKTFARSESGVLRNRIRLMLGDTLVATYDNGEEV